MAKNDILAEAIADARKVKSAALANAKLALEETFTPTLQRMISSRIAEEEGDEEMGMEDDFNIDVNMEGEGDFAPEGEMGEEPVTGFGGGEEEAAPEEDLELEALIRELDGEEGMEDPMMESDCEDDESMMEGEEEQWLSTNPSSERDQFSEGEEMDDELTEALNALLEEEGLGDDLDMGPNKEDGASYTDSPTPGVAALTENRKLKKALAQKNKDLNEAYRAVTTLKKTLNEVNLLNGKLMYTTKTFKKFNLNESQQSRILDAFDRTTSIREVKLVYSTICESFNKKPLATKKKVTEGFASKPVNAINPTRKSNSDTGIISESLKDRFQRLANLKQLED